MRGTGATITWEQSVSTLLSAPTCIHRLRCGEFSWPCPEFPNSKYANLTVSDVSAPGCMTYVIFDDLQTANEGLFTSYACGASQAYFKALSTPLKDAAPGSTTEGEISPTGSLTSNPKPHPLSGGVISGIVIGSIIGALLLLGLCFCLWKKKPWIRKAKAHGGPGSFAYTDASIDRPKRPHWFRRTRPQSFQMG